MTLPPVRVEFIGSSDPLVREFQRLNTAMGTTDKGFNTMNAQSQKMSGGFRKATSSITAHIASLRILSVSYLAFRAFGFIDQVIESAAALHDLSQKTGATVEALAVLQFVGKRNEVDAQDLALAFKGLSLALGQLRDGGKDATDAFARIGLSAQSLEGLTVDQAFNRVAQAIARLPAGFDKAEAATKVFGRSGAALIPLINEISEKGLPALTEEARNAGVVMSGTAAASADQFKDALDNLKGAAGGAAITILNPLLPALTALTKEMGLLFGRGGSHWWSGGVAVLRNDLLDIAGVMDLLTLKTTDFRAFLRGKFFPMSGVESGSSSTADVEPKDVKPILTRDAEISALAKIRDAGKLNEAQQQRVNALVKELRVEYKGATGDVVKQADILGQIESLTKTRSAKARETTEAERQALELMRAEAAEAGKILQAEADRRQAVQDRIDLEARAANQRETEARGGFLSFDDMLAKKGAAAFDTSFSPTEQLEKDRRETEAATLAYIRDLHDEADATDEAFRQAGESMKFAVSSDLANFFTDGIMQAKNFGDAIKGLALSVVQSIQRIVAQLIAAQIVKGIAGALFGGGIPAAPTDAIVQGEWDSLPKFAEGGFVSGAGGPTSDSIPAYLSNGEYVVNAAATSRNLPLLQQINAKPLHLQSFRSRGYAGGGLVTTAPTAQGNVTLHVTHEEGMVVKIIDKNMPVLVQNHRKHIRDTTR